MSDSDLAEALHSKYYSDMPFGEFAGKIGFKRNWSDMPAEAVHSAGGNAMEFVQGLGHAVMNPSDTIEGVARLGSGAINNAIPQLSAVDKWLAEKGLKNASDPNAVAEQQKIASQAGSQIADTLTTAEGFKHYLARSPVSAGMDIATGGASLAPKIAGKAAGIPLKKMLRTAPKAESVAVQTKQMFDAIKAKDAQLPVQQFLPARDSLGRFLKDEGITAMDAPQATNQFNRMNDMGRPLQAPAPTNDIYGNRVVHPVPAETRTIPFNELESIRRGAGRVERATNLTDTAATDKMVAGKIKKTIDSYYADAADPALKGEIEAAREMGRRNILAKQIKEMVRQGEEYRSGAEAGIGNKFANYLKSEKGKTLAPAEKKAFRKVSRREGVAGVISTFGGKLGLLTSALTGGIPGVAISLGSRKIAEALVRNAAKTAEKTVLIGRDAQKAGSAATKQLRLERMAKVLLATEASR